jgi:hypothetical protein
MLGSAMLLNADFLLDLGCRSLDRASVIVAEDDPRRLARSGGTNDLDRLQSTAPVIIHERRREYLLGLSVKAFGPAFSGPDVIQ